MRLRRNSVGSYQRATKSFLLKLSQLAFIVLGVLYGAWAGIPLTYILTGSFWLEVGFGAVAGGIFFAKWAIHRKWSAHVLAWLTVLFVLLFTIGFFWDNPQSDLVLPIIGWVIVYAACYRSPALDPNWEAREKQAARNDFNLWLMIWMLIWGGGFGWFVGLYAGYFALGRIGGIVVSYVGLVLGIIGGFKLVMWLDSRDRRSER